MQKSTLPPFGIRRIPTFGYLKEMVSLIDDFKPIPKDMLMLSDDPLPKTKHYSSGGRCDSFCIPSNQTTLIHGRPHADSNSAHHEEDARHHRQRVLIFGNKRRFRLDNDGDRGGGMCGGSSSEISQRTYVRHLWG